MLSPLLVFNWSSEGVWLVVDQGSLASVCHHNTVTLVIWATEGLWHVDRSVDWDVVMVGAKAMSVSIWVVKKSSLEHLVVGGLDTRDVVRWREGDLFGLCMEVLRIPVEGQLSNSLKRVVFVWPDLCDVVDIESVIGCICKWHDLNVQSPRWEVTVFDGIE